MTLAYPVRGEFWLQDAMGRVQNAAVDRQDLNLKWSHLCEEAVDLAFDRFGVSLHSVYLSGQAARNRPGGGSIIVLLAMNAKPPSTAHWASAVSEELRRRSGIKTGLNVHVLRWRDAVSPSMRYTPVQFRLAVNAICIGGRDVTTEIGQPRVDEAVANTMLVSFERRMEKAKAKTLASDSRSRIRSISATVGHAVVSAGYATVMASEDLYTEDLDLRRDLFTMHYPERKDDIQRAYDMAALPSFDPVQVRSYINDTRKWVTPIVEDWLNTYNPERAELLNV